MGWRMAIKFGSRGLGAEPTRMPPPTPTVDHVLRIGRNRRPIKISAIAHKGEITIGPPKPVTGILTLETGECRAAISAGITELVEANRKALEKVALLRYKALWGRHEASLTYDSRIHWRVCFRRAYCVR